MANDEGGRRWITWVLTTAGSLVGVTSAIINFRQWVNWPVLGDMVISALTVAHIAIPAVLSLVFMRINEVPLHKALAYFFGMYTLASVWALLTDLVPILFPREIRSLVYRGMMVSNCALMLHALLTWAKPSQWK